MTETPFIDELNRGLESIFTEHQKHRVAHIYRTHSGPFNFSIGGMPPSPPHPFWMLLISVVFKVFKVFKDIASTDIPRYSVLL